MTSTPRMLAVLCLSTKYLLVIAHMECRKRTLSDFMLFPQTSTTPPMPCILHSLPLTPYDLIEANLHLSSKRRLASGRPSTTTQSPNQDSPKASVNVPRVVLLLCPPPTPSHLRMPWMLAAVLLICVSVLPSLLLQISFAVRNTSSTSH